MIKNKKSNKNVLPLGGPLNKTSQSFTLFDICNCLEEEEQKNIFFMNFVAYSTVAIPEGWNLVLSTQRRQLTIVCYFHLPGTYHPPQACVRVHTDARACTNTHTN